ncbi:ubiquinone/menaquinone biosynthesis C-methylase UbiE [Methanomicrobium sp. W14]|uniref:class I SAM-dependent methyltransferase n=1 Tax=Methanomicrobium sp. W14 TaxID=2817839 RepID=UPI001AE55ED6|nr:class I SAM-dependent methyltransferase [Methanomicrobium sp. W14]MBP2133437.1 ubiquinone/menaquinone biosynthesis C-methylase UbiE [Methanomicrobium sp. W14]
MNETPIFWDEHYKKCRNVWAGKISGLPGLCRGSKVLEAGCGNGKNLLSMTGKGWDITGFDFSKKAAYLCRQNLKNDSFSSVLVSDASDLPFKNSIFDAVFAYHITGHSEKVKRKEIAFEFSRVLKPGGMLYFSEFEVSDLRSESGEETEKNTVLKKNGILTHFFTEAEVKDLFSGLSPVSSNVSRWKMKIKGTEYKRAEINASFKKT